MWVEIAALALGALLLAAVLTGVIRKFALARGMLDQPNERSSHTAPTPRGGGMAIVMACCLAVLILSALHGVPGNLALALLGGVVVAIIGFLDDRHRLSAGLRLAVHFAAAIWAVVWLAVGPAADAQEHLIQLSWVEYGVAILGIVWALNLFNFMDGIDGIAASEAVFVAWAGAALTAVAGGAAGVPAASIVFGAACVGFLLWNWPPASIFMGDVGSGYIGYVIGVLALATTHHGRDTFWVWLILGGTFYVDATVTLIRRLLRGEPVHQAHRSHAYQWLARRSSSHLRVTVAVWMVNLLWLLPCAFLATLYLSQAEWIAFGALTPLVILALALGSGRPEIRIS